MSTWVLPLLIAAVAMAGVIGPLVALTVRDQILRQAGFAPLEQMTHEELLTQLTRIFGVMGYLVHRPLLPEECAFDLILTDARGQRRGVLSRCFRDQVDAAVVCEAAEAGTALGRAAPIVISAAGIDSQARSLAATRGAILWRLLDLAKAVGPIAAPPPRRVSIGAEPAGPTPPPGGRPHLRLIPGRQTGPTRLVR